MDERRSLTADDWEEIAKRLNNLVEEGVLPHLLSVESWKSFFEGNKIGVGVGGAGRYVDDDLHLDVVQLVRERRGRLADSKLRYIYGEAEDADEGS
jgi:hypothetical protein